MVMEQGELEPKSAHDALGPISNFASDGEANRRRALNNLPGSRNMSEFASTKQLVSNELMDQVVADGGVVGCFDKKHLLKRLRERAKSLTTGIRVGAGAPVGRAVLQRLLSMHQPSLPLKALFDPLDR